MKTQSARKTAPVALLKGTTLVDSPRASQPGAGRLSFIDSPEYGAGYLVVGDDVLVGMQKTFLDNLQEHNVVALEDGTFRVDLRETRVGLRLTRDELDFLLSRRQAEGFRIDSAFEAAAPAAKTPAKGAGAKAAKAGGKAATKAKPAAKPVAAKGAKAPKAAKGTAQPVAAEQAPQAEAAQPTVAKGRKGAKATIQAAPKASGKAAKATGKAARTGKAAAQPAAQQAPKATEPVSLDAHRKRKQGASAQAELPGLTEPLRKAARSAALDQSIREPRASATKPATAKAGTAKAAPGGRRKGGATASTAPAGTSARGKTARSNARTQVTGTATTAKGRGKAAGKDSATTAQSAPQGGTATSAQVKDAARAVIAEMKRPVPRQELLKLVQDRLGASVPGKSPVDNMVTILYKDPDGAFENVKSRGFWLKGQDLPAA